MSKTIQDKKTMEKNIAKEVSFVEKELLLNSLTQQELMKTTQDLNKTIKELTKTLKILEKHEYLMLHKSKWKLFGYNIVLGMLFAVGTVLGLVVLSWFTFNFLKDSAILNQIIQNQLKIRQFSISDIQEKVKNDLMKPAQSLSGTKTESEQK
ncbi:hypothetical protein GW864_04585 [bacterium]|nr:hypothetical protein [bacterium]PIQ11945.1 MAG: hypothetical protein COW68_01295 [Candidatus Gracilibacteria bacterium CG18_big_fil_WC_8_21_14_2_50_38_16]PIZ01549.1 MAG: hypothetical protein COY60_02920 [Candidatus Gracilibacteria bacterium CG_4_10_14_0_8_um_filter_38_28]